ncbi:nicotinamide riboside transporter PnuC [Malaciobacter mytili]|uniref:nicotinamide riboside transporter PnuC n=1 Tax=Malaciobacter mytili TaxID=603050 RepID=UPI003A84C2BA
MLSRFGYISTFTKGLSIENFINIVLDSLKIVTFWEAFAMTLSILYLLLAIKQNIWCWVAGFFSTLIYNILFYDALLLMDSFLNLYYLLMSIYGWYSWKYTNKLIEKKNLEISKLSLKTNLNSILILTFLSIILGYIMDNYTQAQYAYLDTFTTVFAIFSTFLLAKKILENWLYWIVIDTISVYIYINKGFYITSILFIFYTILAFIAYINWKKVYANN